MLLIDQYKQISFGRSITVFIDDRTKQVHLFPVCDCISPAEKRSRSPILCAVGTEPLLLLYCSQSVFKTNISLLCMAQGYSCITWYIWSSCVPFVLECEKYIFLHISHWTSISFCLCLVTIMIFFFFGLFFVSTGVVICNASLYDVAQAYYKNWFRRMVRLRMVGGWCLRDWRRGMPSLHSPLLSLFFSSLWCRG